MIKKSYKVLGMHCPSCATAIELDLEDTGVRAKCNYAAQTLEVEFDSQKISEEQVKNVVQKSGYKVSDP